MFEQLLNTLVGRARLSSIEQQSCYSVLLPSIVCVLRIDLAKIETRVIALGIEFYFEMTISPSLIYKYSVSRAIGNATRILLWVGALTPIPEAPKI